MDRPTNRTIEQIEKGSKLEGATAIWQSDMGFADAEKDHQSWLAELDDDGRKQTK